MNLNPDKVKAPIMCFVLYIAESGIFKSIMTNLTVTHVQVQHMFTFQFSVLTII